MQTVSTMAEDIPVFPKAGNLEIHSGNIVNWNHLKRKRNQTSTEELQECITASIQSYLQTANKDELQYSTSLNCFNGKLTKDLPDDERKDLKVTAKLFLCSEQPPDVIKEAVDKLLDELKNVGYLETLMLSLSNMDDITLEDIKPYWEAMEELVDDDETRGTVLTLGICDLDQSRLEELYNWAKVKPCVNQVNLASCCVMPVDLTEYAKQNDIQLLTHNDDPEFIPVKTLQEAISAAATEKDGEHWEPIWALRYSVILKCRGIVKTKGYILRADRDIKKR